MAKAKVEIRQARTSIDVADDQTILDAALSHGVPYPHGCRSGRCGSCKSRLIEGKVELLPHSRFALTPEERADGLILACRAVPISPVAAVAWLGSDDDDALEPSRQIDGVVVSVKALTHDIKRVRVAPMDGAPMLFTAGQYAQFSVGDRPSRSYSMANRHGEDFVEFHVRRVPGGAMSGHIHERLVAGDRVSLEFPLGSAYLRQHHGGPMLCVAGGSGLAPIKSIVDTALAHGMTQPIHVYFGARSERDLYLVEHFEELARQHANLTFTPVLSDPKENEVHRTGFVTEAIAADIPNFTGWKVYVAGPPPMVDAAMQLTMERGLRAEDMHADVFFTPK